MSTDKATAITLAMKRFADATSAYMLADAALKEALREVLEANNELRALGVNFTFPGGTPAGNAAPPAAPPAAPVDEDQALREAIKAAEGVAMKPPKTDAT